jgi:tRNA A-37 threonylcarbamoyl transferase component Bud32
MQRMTLRTLNLMSTQTKRLAVRFEPKPNDIVALFGQKYYVQPHPFAAYMPYASEGRRAVVYQLRNAAGENYALKVFRKKFRNDSLLASINLLNRFATLEGMRAARRQVIAPTDNAARQCRDLQYAMLMQWVRGQTWYDVLIEARRTGTHLALPAAIHLCARFLNVMRGLEAAGIAHGDIAPGNVMVEVAAVDVQLIDLEDIYVPGESAPEQRNTGSTGYRHHSAEQGATTWCSAGDRYAAAVLAAEMLVLAEPQLARRATDEGYFVGHCQSSDGVERYNAAQGWLKKTAPDFATLFAQAWLSDSLAQCHKLAELHAAILPVALQTPRAPEPTITLPVKWSRLNIEKGQAKRRAGVKAGKPSPVTWGGTKLLERRQGQTGLGVVAKVSLGGAALLVLWLLFKLLVLFL